MALFSSKRPALDPKDQADFERLCGLVDRHVADYAAVGHALREIRDRKLYRATHETFEAFTAEKWQIDDSHARRLIAAAAVARNLAPTGTVPATERQARPLAPLDEQQQVAAWNYAKELAAPGPVTTAHVEDAAATIAPKRRKKRGPKPIRVKVPGGLVIIQPGKAFTNAAAALTDAIAKLTSQAKAA